MRAPFLLSSVVALAAHAQFPLSQPATGDTVYPGTDLLTPVACWPWGPGALLPMQADPGTRLVRLDDDGTWLGEELMPAAFAYVFGSTDDSPAPVIVGRTIAQRAYIARLNGTADGVQWTDSLMVNNETYFSNVTVLGNGDLLACGTSYVTPMDLRPIVRRYGPGGQLLWTYSLPGQPIERAVHGRELYDGALLITGLSGPPMPGNIQVLCQRISATGALQATSTMGTGGFQQGHKVLERPAGGSMIFGRKDSPIAGLVMRVDDQCTLLDERAHPGLALYDACFDPLTSAYLATGHRDQRCLVARFNDQGDTLWTRTYAEGIGRHIRPDGHGGFLVSGTSTDTVSGTFLRPYMLRVDGDGSMVGLMTVGASTGTAQLLDIDAAGGAWIHVAAPCRWTLLDATGRLVDEGRIAQAGRAWIPAPRSRGLALLQLRDDHGRTEVLRWTTP